MKKLSIKALREKINISSKGKVLLVGPYINFATKAKFKCLWNLPNCKKSFHSNIYPIANGISVSCGCYSGYNSRIRFKKYTCNDSFFKDINSESKAYFLGFMFADGCVHKDKRANSYVMKVMLNIKDKQILQTFKESLNATNPVTVNKRKNDTVCRIDITSNELCNDLIKHGCTQRKSLTLKFPTTVPRHLMHHFIRGYFDGDGWLYVEPSKISGKFGVIGSDMFIGGLQKEFNKILKPNKITKEGNVSKIQFGGRFNCYILYKYLYKDATIYLTRKSDRFKIVMKNNGWV